METLSTVALNVTRVVDTYQHREIDLVIAYFSVISALSPEIVIIA